jgi:hypothetical protein
MAGSRTLKLAILADVDGLRDGLKKGQNELGGFEKTLTDFGKKIAAAFAFEQIVQFGVEVSKAAMAEEESITRLNQTLATFTGATQAQLDQNSKFIESLSNATAIADDNLRPAMTRLARSLGDVESAQKATDLAARISVNTGKDVETVANAMAKAADGQTGALAKLGLGFGAADLKGKSFGEIVDMLNGKFPDLGANAETTSFKFKQFQNLIDNTKESIGAALLPILSKFFTFVIENLNPALDRLAKIFDPIKKAIEDNKDAFNGLLVVGKFIVEQMISRFEDMATAAAKMVAIIINVFGKIEEAVRPVINFIIDAINKVISGINLIKTGSDIPSLGRLGSSGSGSSGGGGGSSVTDTISLVNAISDTAGSLSSLGGKSVGTAGNSAAVQKAFDKLASDVADATTLMEILTSPTFTDPTNIARESARGAYYNITVNGAIDSEGTAQTIVNVLQDSINRGGVAAGFIPRNML